MILSRRRRAQGFTLLSVLVILTLLASLVLIQRTVSDGAIAASRPMTEAQNIDYAVASALEHMAWSLNAHGSCTGYQNLSTRRLGAFRYSGEVSPTSGSPVNLIAAAETDPLATRRRTRYNVAVYDTSLPQTLVINDAVSIKDVFIEGESGHTDHNKATDKDIIVSAETGKVERGLIEFDLSLLPTNARIESATLELELNSFGSTQPVYVHRVTAPWTEADVTWDTTDGTTAWITAGGDFDAQAVTEFVANGVGLYQVDLTSQVAAWYRGEHANFGVLLQSPVAGNVGANRFTSADDGGGTAPTLRITYVCECGSQCALAASGPLAVAHWRLDDGQGLIARDRFGAHNGVVEQGAYWDDAGQIDGSLQFDGLNDYVSVPHDDALSVTSAFTITAWVRHNDADMPGAYRVLSKTNAGGNDDYFLAVDGGVFLLGLNGDFFFSTDLLTGQRWYHLAATFDADAGEVRLYQDGVEVLNQSTNADPGTSAGPLYLGADINLTRLWYGQLDDVRLFDEVLGIDEITDIMNTPATGSAPGATVSYRDHFDALVYSGDDGALSWASDWLEVGESNGSTSGDVRVLADGLNEYALRIRDNDNGGEGVQRRLDLSTCTTAELAFDYRRNSLDDADDYVAVEVSGDNGASWQQLVRLRGEATDSQYLHHRFDVTAYRSSDSRIRFLGAGDLGNFDQVYLDNVAVDCVR